MQISNKEVERIIPEGSKAILDNSYTLPSDAEVLNHVSLYYQDPKHHILGFEPDKHDCDNYAVELLAWFSGKGWPFGLAVFEGHAANFYINDKKEIKYIEPQTGQLYIPKTRLKITVMT